MFVASEEPTSGSVIEKQERMSPFNSGFSHFSFCSDVPYRTSTSILPVSGAPQLKASGPIIERPIISQRGAYSTFVRPAPYSLSGKNKFHNPACFAFSFNSSMIGGTADHLDGCSFSCCSYSRSFG
jgi:hypothetical protein